MKENKAHYLAPKISVVAFKIESGFQGSLYKVNTRGDMPGANVSTYSENTGFSSAFRTGGSDDSHFDN